MASLPGHCSALSVVLEQYRGALYRGLKLLKKSNPIAKTFKTMHMERRLQNDRWDYINLLDAELLKGGIILSEWCSFIVRDSDLAFVGGAYLSCILTAVSAIETHLRYEYGSSKDRLVDLVNKSGINPAMKDEIHSLRKYRNSWVHVEDPIKDDVSLSRPEEIEKQLEAMALLAVRVLRKTIYDNPWI